jgi:CBS domain-containing protein
VYDYVDGKVDWMAYGLPVEGDDGPFAGEFASEVPTVGPDEPVSSVLPRLGPDGPGRVVVTTADGVVLGLVERGAVDGAPADAPVATVMELSPSTVRPSVEYATLVEQGDDHVLVTTSDGRLVGMVEPTEADDDAGDDAGRSGPDLERDLLETIEAVAEHFGDHDPTEEEIRGYLRDRLVAEGRSPDEADRFLTAIADQPGD